MSEGRIPGPAVVVVSGRGCVGGSMGNLIRSERLALRQLETEEARLLLQGRPTRSGRGCSRLSDGGTLIAVEAFVRAVDNGADPGAWGVYQLVRSGDDMVVGDIGFHGPPNPGGSVTVGYGLAPGARGRATRPRRCGRWSLGRWSSRRWRRSRRRHHPRQPALATGHGAGRDAAVRPQRAAALLPGSLSGGAAGVAPCHPAAASKRSARHAHCPGRPARGRQGDPGGPDRGPVRGAHIATGDILRSNADWGTELGRTASRYMDQGELVPDDVIIDMVLERMGEGDCAEGSCSTGFRERSPRPRPLSGGWRSLAARWTRW